MHHPNLRLERWLRQALYGVFALLTISGASWLLAHYFLAGEGDSGPLVHPLAPWSLRVHGLGVILALLLVGVLFNGHVRRAHRARRNRLPGYAMLALLTWLTLSGYALYYWVSEDSRAWISLTHWATGLSLIPLLLWHIVRGRRMRPER